MKKVGLIVLCILLLIIFFVMVRTPEDYKNFSIKGKSFLEDIRIIHKENGEPLWILSAKKAEFIEDNNKAELEDIRLSLPKNELMLSAGKGIYSFSEQSFTTNDIVKAESKDYKITADTIYYEISSGTIKTNGKVILETKSFSIEGTGMKTDGREKVRILNDVKAIFNK